MFGVIEADSDPPPVKVFATTGRLVVLIKTPVEVFSPIAEVILSSKRSPTEVFYRTDEVFSSSVFGVIIVDVSGVLVYPPLDGVIHRW